MRARALVVAVAGLVATSVSAEDWPHWRGPNRNGISSETGFAKKWDDTPPRVWEAAIGPSYSGFACVGGKVYTCGSLDGSQVLFCLDAKSGKIIWQTSFEEEFRNRFGSGTRATPTVSEGRVYILGGHGTLACVDAERGKTVWQRRFNAPPTWGYSASVLIDGDLAIATAGGDAGGALVALNRKTGDPVWSCGGGLVGYATPQPFDFEGRRYVVAFMGKEAFIADIETGRQVWSMPWETEWDVNASTPIIHDDRLFLSSGYKHGAILLKLARAGEALAVQTVWQNKNIRAKFQSPVLYGNHLYISDEVGLKTVDFATGALAWSMRNVKHGPLVIADGHIVLLTEEGRLRIAKASPSSFDAITDVPLMSGRHWTVPTLYDGHLYVRNLESAACYKLTR